MVSELSEGIERAAELIAAGGPVVVFTGPADHPDTIAQTASAAPKKKKKAAAKTTGKKEAKTDGKTDSAEKAAKATKPAKPAKPAVKPKVTSVNQ